MNRRSFLLKTGTAAAGLALSRGTMFGQSPVAPTQSKLPRWRGFNCLDFFYPEPWNPASSTISTDDDFRWMRDWGFDFVRLPMAYPQYLDVDYTKPMTPADVYRIDERKVERIDDFVTRAHRFGLHVNLNLHRAPGYCINDDFDEPYNLWSDEEAQNAFYHHWGFWAERYRAISADQISFDLVNEPSFTPPEPGAKKGAVPPDVYRKVVIQALAAIKQANPYHLVIADGNKFGLLANAELADLDVGQSCRGYFPNHMSRFGKWVSFPVDGEQPQWPGTFAGQHYDRSDLEEHYQPWIDLARQGIGVHCGELGCWNKTPHTAFLAWFEDVLDILTSHNIGWALWNFRGDFGVLDSRRQDVAYEDWRGHKLDRQLLDLLQEY